jgi:hypothetical protein
MKKRYYVGLNFRSDRFPAAQEFFRAIGRDDLANAPKAEFGYSFHFTKIEELIRFQVEAARFGFDVPQPREDKVYSDRECLEAPLLHLVVRRAERGYGGPRYGTQYDLSKACPECGSGAVQIGPLVLRRGDAPKKRHIWQTLDHEYLVSPLLALAIRDSGANGFEMRPAISHKDGEPLPWLQLVSHYQMPPMSPETKGITRSESDFPCLRCGRDAYFGALYEPEEIAYSHKDVDPHNLPDVVHTYERFGIGRVRKLFRDSHMPNPNLLIKPRVFAVFRQLKVQGVQFIPVAITSHDEQGTQRDWTTPRPVNFDRMREDIRRTYADEPEWIERLVKGIDEWEEKVRRRKAEYERERASRPSDSGSQ